MGMEGEVGSSVSLSGQGILSLVQNAVVMDLIDVMCSDHKGYQTKDV